MTFTLNMTRRKWISVGKGALIAAVGAGLAYLTQWASGGDLGPFTPLVVAFLSVLTNTVRKAAQEG